MRFICHIMRADTCFGRVVVENTPGKSAEELIEEAKRLAAEEATKKQGLTKEDILDVSLVIEEYARIISEGLVSGKSSQWTVLTKEGKAHTQPDNYAVLTEAKRVSRHINFLSNDLVKAINETINEYVNGSQNKSAKNP